MTIPRTLVVLAACCFSAPAFTLDIPHGPDRPRSGAECVQAFAAAFQEHYRQDHCRPCSGDLEGWPGARWAARYTACYKRCGSERSAQHKQLMDARQACAERARSHASQEEQERLTRAEGMRLGQRMTQAASAAERAHALLDSPKRFFERAIQALPGAAMKALRGTHKDDPVTVEAQVHAYAFTQARAGVEAAARLRAGSPLIRRIQLDSLDRLERIHGEVTREFDVAMHSIERDLSGHSSAPASSFRPTPVRPLGGNATRAVVDCGILDTPASSDLAIDQPEVFERLVAGCRDHRRR